MKAFTINSHGKSWAFDPVSWSEEFVQDMLEQGVKIRLDRSSASDKTAADRLISCQTVYDKLVKGILPSGGARGPRADAEGLADVEWLKKAYGKTSQKTLESDWLSFTAVLLIKGGKAGTKDPDLMAKAQAAVQGVKAQARTTKAWLAFKAAADVKTGEMEETSFVPTFE